MNKPFPDNIYCCLEGRPTFLIIRLYECEIGEASGSRNIFRRPFPVALSVCTALFVWLFLRYIVQLEHDPGYMVTGRAKPAK